MAVFKTAVLVFVLTLLVGCSGTLSQVKSTDSTPGYFPVNSAAFLFQGSAVQWNQHYAVSVAHMPMLSGVVHRCSTGCDLVFIRREAQGQLPVWRPTSVGEAVETVGQSRLMITMKGKGTSKATKVRLDREGDNTAYSLNDAPVVKGMSGGPVYGNNGAVIGMTIGIFVPGPVLPAELRNSESLSVYVPYEIIQREWRIFSGREALATLTTP